MRVKYPYSILRRPQNGSMIWKASKKAWIECVLFLEVFCSRSRHSLPQGLHQRTIYLCLLLRVPVILELLSSKPSRFQFDIAYSARNYNIYQKLFFVLQGLDCHKIFGTVVGVYVCSFQKRIRLKRLSSAF